MSVRLAVLVLLGLGTVAAAAEEPPYKRLLQGDDATKAEALKKRIEELREVCGFQEAQAMARTLLELRSCVQGENHWQTGDARGLVSTLEKIAALSAVRNGESGYNFLTGYRQWVHSFSTGTRSLASGSAA
jgi:hypothetical protein